MKRVFAKRACHGLRVATHPGRPRSVSRRKARGPGAARGSRHASGSRVHLAPPDPPRADGFVSRRPWGAEGAPAIVDAIDGEPEIATWLGPSPQPFREA